MKLNSKGKFEAECLFLKLLSQSFEGFTPCGDVINPKIGQKVQKKKGGKGGIQSFFLIRGGIEKRGGMV